MGRRRRGGEHGQRLYGCHSSGLRRIDAREPQGGTSQVPPIATGGTFGARALRGHPFLAECRGGANIEPMLGITSSEIHLWLLYCQETSDARLLERCRGCLSAEEQERERRFRDPADQHRHRLTRTLVRTVLSRYAPISPSQWYFRADQHGRPQILNQEPAAGALIFNVAHTREVIILAVTAGAALGVDVESVR